jgi:hypothetical protein
MNRARRELKVSRAWIAGGVALFVISVALMCALSLGPVTSIFRCERLTEDHPGECRLEQSFVFWPDKVVSFQESALRGAERIPSLPGVNSYGGGPVQVGLRLTSGQVVPIIGPDWPFVAETSIQRINVYLANRSALSLVIKPYCLTSLYLFCDIIVALILIGVLGCYLPRKQHNKYEGAQDGLYDKRKP